MSIKNICLVAMSLTLFACTETKNETGNKAADNEATQKTEDVKSHESKRVETKNILISGEFYQITNIGSPNIIFTEGPCSITAEGTPDLLDMVKATVDSGTLTVNLGDDENIDVHQFSSSNNNVTLHISCPELRILALCSSGNFTSESDIHTSDIHIGTLSTGSIVAKNIICSGSFKYESSDKGTAVFEHIQAGGDSKFLLGGEGATVADIDITAPLYVDLDSHANLELSGNASELEIMGFGQSHGNFSINADKLTVTALGHSWIKLTGNYKSKEINRKEKGQVTFE